MEDKIAMYVMIGLIAFVVFLILFAIWAMCKAAGDADATAEWNRNWTGQKFDKED